MLLEAHKEIAVKAAIAAGKAIMEVYETVFEVTHKADDSPFTIADEKANAIILGYLKGTEIPILSEEGEIAPYTERKHWENCWIVDPLDGTKEFVHRHGDFTVNIAYVAAGKPLFGVIYIPVTQELYVGDVEKECMQKVRLDGDAVADAFAKAQHYPIPQPKETKNNIRVATSRSHLNKATEAYVKELKETYETAECIARGSSLKFCLLAEGKIDVYPRFSPTMEWDTAAGQAICSAVGIQVMDLASGKAIRYNREELRNGSFVAQRN